MALAPFLRGVSRASNQLPGAFAQRRAREDRLAQQEQTRTDRLAREDELDAIRAEQFAFEKEKSAYKKRQDKLTRHITLLNEQQKSLNMKYQAKMKELMEGAKAGLDPSPQDQQELKDLEAEMQGLNNSMRTLLEEKEVDTSSVAPATSTGQEPQVQTSGPPGTEEEIDPYESSPVKSGIDDAVATQEDIRRGTGAAKPMDGMMAPEPSLESELVPEPSLESELVPMDDKTTADIVPSSARGDRAGGNLPQRNNNPGNIKKGGQADSLAIDEDKHGHLIFPDAETGMEALRREVRAKVSGNTRTGVGPDSTLAELGQVYAEDPNWANSVGQILKTSPDTILSDIPEEKLVDAIARQEGFYADNNTDLSAAPLGSMMAQGSPKAAPEKIGGMRSRIAEKAREEAAAEKESKLWEAHKKGMDEAEDTFQTTGKREDAWNQYTSINRKPSKEQRARFDKYIDSLESIEMGDDDVKSFARWVVGQKQWHAVDGLSGRDRTAVMKELANMGESYYLGMNDRQVENLAQGRIAVEELAELTGLAEENEDLFGPIAGKVYPALIGTDLRVRSKRIMAKLGYVTQRVGKMLEGGVLRKEDEEKYRKMLPQLEDEPGLAIHKLRFMIKGIKRQHDNYIEYVSRSGRWVDPDAIAKENIDMLPVDPEKATFKELLFWGSQGWGDELEETMKRRFPDEWSGE